MKKIKPVVFLPPFLLLLAVVVLNFINKDRLTSDLTNAYAWVLSTFGEVFAVTPFLMLLTCVVIYFCPFAPSDVIESLGRPTMVVGRNPYRKSPPETWK